MPRIDPLQVWLEVSNTRLSEHSSKLVERTKVLCHVASETGKNFVICFSHSISIPASKPGVQVVAKILVDGVQTNHIILKVAGQTTVCKGPLTTSPNPIHRPFTFRNFPRSLNGASHYQAPSPIGSIEIIVRLATVKVLKPHRDDVHGLPISIEPLSAAKYPPIYVEYLYAPREVWEAQGVIPRPIRKREPAVRRVTALSQASTEHVPLSMSSGSSTIWSPKIDDTASMHSTQPTWADILPTPQVLPLTSTSRYVRPLPQIPQNRPL